MNILHLFIHFLYFNFIIIIDIIILIDFLLTFKINLNSHFKIVNFIINHFLNKFYFHFLKFCLMNYFNKFH